MFLGIKSDFYLILLDSGEDFLWRHIRKSRKGNNIKFGTYTGLMHTIITGTKFQINQLTVTLFSWSRPKARTVANEISKCRRQ